MSPDEGMARPDCPLCFGSGKTLISGDCPRCTPIGSDPVPHRASGEGGSPSALRASAPEGQDTRCTICTGDASSLGSWVDVRMGYQHTGSETRYGNRLVCRECRERIIEAIRFRWSATPASVEADQPRGLRPLAPEGIDAVVAAARAVRKMAAGIHAWCDEGIGSTPDWALARDLDQALLAAVDALDSTPQADAKAIPSPAPQAPPPEGIAADAGRSVLVPIVELHEAEDALCMLVYGHKGQFPTGEAMATEAVNKLRRRIRGASPSLAPEGISEYESQVREFGVSVAEHLKIRIEAEQVADAREAAALLVGAADWIMREVTHQENRIGQEQTHARNMARAVREQAKRLLDGVPANRPTTDAVVIVDRAIAERAADHLDAEADCLRESHTIGGSWPEVADEATREAKADHDSMRACAAALRAKP